MASLFAERLGRSAGRHRTDLEQVDPGRDLEGQFGVLLDQQQRRTGVGVDVAEHAEQFLHDDRAPGRG